MRSTYLAAIFVLLIILPKSQAFWPQLPIEIPLGNRAEQTESDTKDTATEDSAMNLFNKTAGGTQWWTDHVWKNGYRIQQNALTEHWRLLNPSDTRLTWGTRKECDTELAKQNMNGKDKARAVVLLHGLMRTHHSMKSLEQELATQSDTAVIRFAYASSRESISEHAAALRDVLEGLPIETRISFVGHSMGNIVVRHLIGDLQNEGDPKQILSRCEAMVMLGPPNQGAAIARRLSTNTLYGWVTGKGGLELGPEWDAFEKRLATPPFPFAILAGDVSENSVQNPLVDGASDFVVSIEEAKLEGAEVFKTVPALHSFLMSNDEARKFTIDFLASHQSPKDKDKDR
ncbi:Alpha/beta hydrolase family protein [Planctomycetes bacterium CA13]|uniref:Alpha/beta hydrolase family protein n=1 Tax=Novipirellula herctigrandis TaxID=2527986 RepID=A0A5C5Z0Y7_9BACT|nr:Alpha/beta hydrolase family protein [Planctomycetes bacterium CA13]